MALPEDTIKVQQLSDLCYAYRRIDADSALFFGQQALELARRLHDARGEAQACNDMAIIHMDRSAYATADSLLRQALSIRTALNDPAGMAAIHNKLGNIFQARFDLEEALEENIKALEIYERIGPPAYEALILNNIAILQFNLRRYPTSLATHRRAAEIRMRIGDGAGLAASQGNMANVELQLGDTLAAIDLYERSIDYFRKHDLRMELAVQLNNLAGAFLGRGELGKAERHYQEALAIRKDLGDRKAIASSMIGLGGTWTRQGHTDEARHELLEALALSREVDARSEQMQALLDLARLHARLNNGDSSFLYHQRYVALKDSVFNDDLKSRLAESETKYETEKKERQIQSQRADIFDLERRSERRKFWLITTSAIAALIAVTALLLMQVQRRRSRAARDAAIIAEREMGLRGVLHATELERKRIASELHDGVGQQLTGLRFRLEDITLRTADHRPVEAGFARETLAMADEASREVRDIAHAMMPRALSEQGLVPTLNDMLERSLSPRGLAHEFDHFGMEGRMPPEVEVGVYRIAQELMNNTMKHAGAKRVSLQLLKNKGHLVMIFEDDGKGIEQNERSDGIGLRNMRERAHAMHGTFTMGKGIEGGLAATLRIPLKEG